MVNLLLLCNVVWLSDNSRYINLLSFLILFQYILWFYVHSLYQKFWIYCFAFKILNYINLKVFDKVMNESWLIFHWCYYVLLEADGKPKCLLVVYQILEKRKDSWSSEGTETELPSETDTVRSHRQTSWYGYFSILNSIWWAFHPSTIWCIYSFVSFNSS